MLNLAHPDCYAYLLERIDSLLTQYPIAYIKWDHNRDLLEASHADSGTAAVRETTLALYRLLGELKSRHPRLEIESCASGGARVDLGILEHTDRIWTSDCIDPIERLDNQENTNLLVPYELMGAHIGGPRSHSTGRKHDLGFMARTAIFGHFGIEWNIAGIDEKLCAELARWVDFHKENRDLFHGGDSVHADHPDPAIDIRGVVATDASRAVFAFTLREASLTYPAGRFTLPGLDPACQVPGAAERTVERLGRQRAVRAFLGANLACPQRHRPGNNGPAVPRPVPRTIGTDHARCDRGIRSDP